jgi:hypothetical protein
MLCVDEVAVPYLIGGKGMVRKMAAGLEEFNSLTGSEDYSEALKKIYVA